MPSIAMVDADASEAPRGAARARSPSSGDAERRVRQKVHHDGTDGNPRNSSAHSNALNAATDLALDHLLHDAETHPLYQRNVDQVLDSFCSESALQTHVREPLLRLMRQVDNKKSGGTREGAAVRQRLLAGWAERLVKSVGDSMCGAVDMTGDGAHVVMELDKARVELKVIPVVEVAESEVGDEEMDKDEDGEEEEDDSAVDCAPGEEDTTGSNVGEDEDEDEDDRLSEPADPRERTIFGGRELLGYDLGPYLLHASDAPRPSGVDGSVWAAKALLKFHDRAPSEYGNAGRQGEMRLHFPFARQLFQYHYLRTLLPFGRHEALQLAFREAADAWTKLNGDQRPWFRRHELLLAGNAAMLHLENALPEPAEDVVVGRQPAPAPAPKTPPPGFRICHYRTVRSHESVLMLKEPQLPKSNATKRGSRWPTDQEVSEILHSCLPSNDGMIDIDVDFYTKGTWIVQFSSSLAARQAAGTKVSIRNSTTTLIPFNPRLSQVFVCKNIPPNLDISGTLSDLLRALPDCRFQAKKSTAHGARVKEHMLLFLDAPVDIEWFQLTLPTKYGSRWSARFNGWIEGQKCVGCGEGHPLHHCGQLRLVPVQLTGQRDPRLLSGMPVIAS